MVEYFDRKVEAENAEEIASAWMENLRALKNAHPRVFKKVMKEVLEYTGEKEIARGLLKVAEELLDRRHKKGQRLRSAKIALTYKKYLYNHYGSLVKLYLSGEVAYTSRALIGPYGFVIHRGEAVA